MGQVIFNSTNLIMPYQFVQNKFVQKFVIVSLLNLKRVYKYLGNMLLEILLKMFIFLLLNHKYF